MEGNLLLEQFSRYKKLELEASPFHFLLDANIELNPHRSMPSAQYPVDENSGIVLATRLDSERPSRPIVQKNVLESAQASLEFASGS
jgi:hypothetical protein